MSTEVGLPVDAPPARAPGGYPLVGEHVVLERLVEADTDALWNSIGSDHAMWVAVPAGPYRDKAAFAAELVDGIRSASGEAVWCVFDKTSPTREALGIVLLSKLNLRDNTAEVGLMYGAGMRRTRGGTEAVALLCAEAFEALGFRRLEWLCSGANAASNAAARRYGFEFEGTLRQHKILRGRNRDTNIYSMLDREWPARRAALRRWLAPANFDAAGRQRRALAAVRADAEAAAVMAA